MRAVIIALLGVGLLAEPAAAARTAARGAGSTVRVPAQIVAKARPVSIRPVVARPTAPRGFAKSVVPAKPPSGRVRVIAGKSRSNAAKMALLARHPLTRGLVSRAAAASLTRSVGWQHGLPPAAGIQAGDCPSGTMATLARGHDDVVRCLPI